MLDIFLVCALAMQPLAAQGYQIDLGKDEISVIRTLSTGLIPSDRAIIVVWGDRQSWLTLLRAAGLRAWGVMPTIVSWPFYLISTESRIGLLSSSVDLMLFFGDHDFAIELSRVVRIGGFIVFDPKQNPSLEEELTFLGWSRRFDFHEYRVFEHRQGGRKPYKRKNHLRQFRREVRIRWAA